MKTLTDLPYDCIYVILSFYFISQKDYFSFTYVCKDFSKVFISRPSICKEIKWKKIYPHNNPLAVYNLNLFSINIPKIEGLYLLIKLKILNLGFNNITEIGGLRNLTTLEVLNLKNNQITKIEGLGTLTNLRKLYLGWNKITKIEGLSTLKNLMRLNLSGNKITKIEGLDELTNLMDLNLSWNKITKIEGLNNLINLKILKISDNRLKNVEFLKIQQPLNKLGCGKYILHDSHLVNVLRDKHYGLKFCGIIN